MDKPAERLTREKQFRVRVPIGAILLIQLYPNLPRSNQDGYCYVDVLVFYKKH